MHHNMMQGTLQLSITSYIHDTMMLGANCGQDRAYQRSVGFEMVPCIGSAHVNDNTDRWVAAVETVINAVRTAWGDIQHWLEI